MHNLWSYIGNINLSSSSKAKSVTNEQTSLSLSLSHSPLTHQKSTKPRNTGANVNTTKMSLFISSHSCHLSSTFFDLSLTFLAGGFFLPVFSVVVKDERGAFTISTCFCTFHYLVGQTLLLRLLRTVAIDQVIIRLWEKGSEQLLMISL